MDCLKQFLKQSRASRKFPVIIMPKNSESNAARGKVLEP